MIPFTLFISLWIVTALFGSDQLKDEESRESFLGDETGGPQCLVDITDYDDEQAFGGLLYVQSKMNRISLIYRNYMFSMNKRIPATNTAYWRCTFASSRKKVRCSVRCVTKDRRLVKYIGVHNHPPTVSSQSELQLLTANEETDQSFEVKPPPVL